MFFRLAGLKGERTISERNKYTCSQVKPVMMGQSLPIQRWPVWDDKRPATPWLWHPCRAAAPVCEAGGGAGQVAGCRAPLGPTRAAYWKIKFKKKTKTNKPKKNKKHSSVKEPQITILSDPGRDRRDNKEKYYYKYKVFIPALSLFLSSTQQENRSI